MEALFFGVFRYYIKVDKKSISLERRTRRNLKEVRELCPVKNIKKIYAAFQVIWYMDEEEVRHKKFEYGVWLEPKKGKKIKLFGKDTVLAISGKQHAEELAEKINSFLQTEDKPKSSIIRKQVEIKPKIVKPKSVQKPKIPRRKIIKEQDSTKLKIQDIRKGTFVNYKLQTWEVAEQIQYDWGQGSTYILYRLNNSENKEILLLIAQDLGIYKLWIEKRLTYQELVKYKLDKIRYEPPLELTFKGEVFFKQYIEMGYEFVADVEYGVKIKQYAYLSENRKHSLRILHHEDEDIFVFWGKKAENFEFSKIVIP